MNSLDAAFLHDVGKHFVSISCIYRQANTTSWRTTMFSGFVIDVLDEWFYITAGHIPSWVKRCKDAGVRFDSWRLCDPIGRSISNYPIPFDYVEDHWCVLNEKDTGLDYAALPLRPLYRNGLEKGGTVPLNKSVWSDHFVQGTQWVLVGIPGETIHEIGQTIKANLVSIPLIETTPPVLDKVKIDNQFYAQLNEKSGRHVDRIEGMSGGPIFSVDRVDGVLKYSVIGIQSAWYPDYRIIIACPFSTFGEALEMIVREARHKLSQPKTAMR